MNKIRVIDLLNKVANEEAPKKIKYENRILYFDEELQNYYDEEDMHPIFNDYIGQRLHFEVEIIEDNKKIEKLFNCEMKSKNGEITILVANINDLKDKINEIIDLLNKEN